MKSLTLPRLLSSGMILQKEKRIHIWGWDEPGSSIEITFRNESISIRSNKEGRFDGYLSPRAAGGPYTMEIADDAGNVTQIDDILIGTVWFVSGQSNIDIDMERCRDNYVNELSECKDDGIRFFQVSPNADYHDPINELLSGSWKKTELTNIFSFSAAGYFFANQVRKQTGMPVGIIQASLGGSRITSWLSKKMLNGYTNLIAEAMKYSDDKFLQSEITNNEILSSAWHDELDKKDKGIEEHWENDSFENLDGTIELPCIFENTGLKGFSGSVWLFRTLSVSKDMAGKCANLWLGTMVDSDTVFVNGKEVGQTAYQYPPRKYSIPAGTLLFGTNTIAIRLVVENGMGRVTPRKGYFIFNEQGVIRLDGEWKYRIGTYMEQISPTNFVNWKATGLFNGTAFPCTNYPVEGMVWYQGESNTHEKYDYRDLLERYVYGYRELWGEELPFLLVQLPNFSIDNTDEEEWPDLREKQRSVLTIPKTRMAVTIDIGEDNDLHPHEKKELGRRLALMAGNLAFGRKEEYSGPVPVKAGIIERNNQGIKVCLELEHSAGLFAKGDRITDFSFVDDEGRKTVATAKLGDNCITLSCDEYDAVPLFLLYCYCNTPTGALIYNDSDLPMSPFRIKIDPRL